MYSFQISSIKEPVTLPTSAYKLSNYSPNDVWLFTAPAARAAYAARGQLSELEQDIRQYVMFENAWGTDELEFKREINRLVHSKVLAPRKAFGHLSPHPTIYQANDDGILQICGERYYFKSGEDIVFEPWPARLAHPGLRGPLRIGRLEPTIFFGLCCEEFSQLDGLSRNRLALLHHIAYYQKFRN